MAQGKPWGGKVICILYPQVFKSKTPNKYIDSEISQTRLCIFSRKKKITQVYLMITTLRPLHQARPEEECLPVWWPRRRPTTGAKQSFICIKDHQDCYRRGPSLNEELSHDWCKCPIAPPLWLEVGHVAHVRASRDASCEASCVLTLSPIKASPRCFFFHIYFWSLLVD